MTTRTSARLPVLAPARASLPALVAPARPARPGRAAPLPIAGIFRGGPTPAAAASAYARVAALRLPPAPDDGRPPLDGIDVYC